MRSLLTLTVVTVAVALVAGDAMAQRRGFGRGGGGRNPGFGKVQLLGVEKVAENLGLSDEQKKQVADLQQEMRDQRGDRGPRGDRQNFRDMSEDERTAFREERAKQAAERQQLEMDKLTQILSGEQLERLNQVYLQVRGASALLDKQVQADLGLSEETVKKLTSTVDEANQERGSQMRELFQSGDREAMRMKMAELTQAFNEKVLGVLSKDEQDKFAAMQGEKLDVSMQDLFRGFGGRGNRGGG
ncbi:MAG: hypothetical protein KDA37_14995, partial [Planctomycetales bacterium]|nr:hypothetical protein [Planctomycetales bacterium]